MKLYRFRWHEQDKHREWQAVARTAGEACAGFCHEHPEVDEFSLNSGGDVAMVEVHLDGSGVAVT